MWKVFISHDQAGPRNNPLKGLKVGEKESIMSQSMQDREISHAG